MVEEIRDLYNERKEVTGEKIYKGEEIPKNRYIIVVTLFITNNKNELLLQKRSKKKGGKYGFLSGHPKLGETSIQGIMAEAKEEIGIDIKNDELKLFHTEKNKNTFFDFYYLKKEIDISKLCLQKEEVEELEWFSISKIEEIIKKENFFINHIEAFDIIKDYIKNGKSCDSFYC